MSIERAPKIESGNEIKESFEHKKLRVRNEIQGLIWNTVCGMDDDSCVQDWIDNYAPSFEIIFNEVTGRDSAFLDKWDNNLDERNVSLDFFMEELRKLDGPKQGKAA